MAKGKSNDSYESGYTIQASTVLELDGGLAKGLLEDALADKLKKVGFRKLLNAIESL